MTGNNTKAMYFGNFLIMFWKYWDYASKGGTDYKALEVVLLTNVLFMDLRTQWEKNGWDVEMLKWICATLDHNYDILNGNYFTNCRFAYFDSSCYFILFGSRSMSERV